MQTAIFSDVHGNLTALQAVLEAIDRQGVDEIFFAGDLCLFGPRPAECLDLVRGREIASVYGNTDEYITGLPLLSDDIKAEERARRQHIDEIKPWTHVQLGEDKRGWLRSLPFHRRISPTPNPRDDLFIVHANPLDVEQPIYPPLNMQRDLYGEVKQTDNELVPLLKDVLVGAIAFGHLHIPNVRHWGDMTLANISSVSLPLDHDRRAKYGLLTWHNGWSVEHHYVDYDIDAEIAAYESNRPPGWEERAEQFREMRSWA